MSKVRAYHVPPGLYCVPSAICALTGADLESALRGLLAVLDAKAAKATKATKASA